MRRDTRHHLAAGITKINQLNTIKKKEDRSWVQCHICEDWLFEETYFKTDWYTGQAVFYPNSPISYSGTGTNTYRICNACCHTAEDVVDYLTDLTDKNTETYDKSHKEWVKAKKKKEKEALAIVDGKSYSFTFKEVKGK